MCTEQNVTVGVPASEGRRSSARTMRENHAPSTFTCGALPEDKHHKVRLKGVLVEHDSEVRVASVRNELLGDVRNMITGFLKNNRMIPSASRCNDIGGVPARWAWVPLKN